MNGETIYDRKGTLIAVGARVLDEHGIEEGTVSDLIELDGDAHDDGTPYAVGPFVVVKYDDGCEERWTASWNATGPWDDHRSDYTCDDVEVAAVDSDDREGWATDEERNAGEFRL